MNCWVCEGESRHFALIDFNRSCEVRNGLQLPPAGPVTYRRCGSCGHIFAPEFAQWSTADFAARVYNDAYLTVDPDYLAVRPQGNADVVAAMFSDQANVGHLDYGGGNGAFSAKLRALGWNSRSYDPYVDTEPLVGQFKFVTCFEVFEHSAHPHQLLEALAAATTPNGILFFSTATNDECADPSWWYIAPRNGHCSIFSHASLKLLLRQHGFLLHTLSNSFHVAVKRLA